MKIDPDKKADLSAQIAHSIRDAIVSGDMIVDERLPSEALTRVASDEARFILTLGRTTTTSTEPPTEALPTRFALAPSYPNPFAQRTTLRYDVPRSADVHIRVYDLLGRQVAVLMDGPKEPGRYSVAFDGEGLASGIYIVRMSAPGFTETQKLMRLR